MTARADLDQKRVEQVTYCTLVDYVLTVKYKQTTLSIKTIVYIAINIKSLVNTLYVDRAGSACFYIKFI